jgi:hypothetical protein
MAFRICVLGNRLLEDQGSGNCTKEEGSTLWNTFCHYEKTDNHTMTVCDPYFLAHNATRTPGIKGLTSGVVLGNYDLIHEMVGCESNAPSVTRVTSREMIITSYKIISGIT